MQITTFTHLKNVCGTLHTCDIDTLAKALLTPVAIGRQKSEVPLWSPTTFIGNKRSGANAISLDCLVYDIDDGLTQFDTWRMFAKYTLLAHTSYSHKPQHHKYRIILPLAEPVPAQDWDRASTAANELWRAIVGRGAPDQSALHDRGRAYYRYTHPHTPYDPDHPLHPNQYHYTARHDGQLLRLDYSHIKVKTANVRRTVTTLRGTNKKTMDMAYRDPAVREVVANTIGATIQNGVARDILCPGCGQNTVYFAIDCTPANATTYPQCNRVNKCGWYGKLQDLLGGSDGNN